MGVLKVPGEGEPDQITPLSAAVVAQRGHRGALFTMATRGAKP